MVKLTTELIMNSYQFINPVKDRELDLRGKISRAKYNGHCGQCKFVY